MIYKHTLRKNKNLRKNAFLTEINENTVLAERKP